MREELTKQDLVWTSAFGAACIALRCWNPFGSWRLTREEIALKRIEEAQRLADEAVESYYTTLAL